MAIFEKLTPAERARQLGNPEGEVGIAVADWLNETNKAANAKTVALLGVIAGDHVLEIGFGNGRTVPDVIGQAADVRYTGIDISPTMVAEASRFNAALVAAGQRIIANLGRKETVLAHGDLDRLARSVARLAQRSMVLSVDQGEAPPDAACRRIGPALVFDRLWQEAGCRAVLTALAGQRQFAFAVERAVFLTVLHRLFVSGSDRAAEKWRADHRIDGTEGLQLHHLYRAMAWLGEPLADQKGASGLAPRCRKDLVEEELFTRRRDLFAELSVVFMDTTSLSFEGRGGAELGRRGHSKDFRPDLNQMIATTGIRVVTSAVLPGHISQHSGRPS